MQIDRSRTSISRSYSLVVRGVVVGVLAAALLFGGIPAQATNGDPVIAGQYVSATATTGILANSSGSVFDGENGGSGSGVNGYSNGGSGVLGDGNFGSGVEGFSSGGNGVYGHVSTSASGVYGENIGTGFGVAGRANNGVGVLADSLNGAALRVNGKAEFSRSGNTVTITYPAKSKTVTGLSLSSNSIVFATLQRYLAGVYVVAAVPNPGAGSFTIYLNKAPGTSTTPKSVTVGWFVVDHCCV